jgi:hypothetical protein
MPQQSQTWVDLSKVWLTESFETRHTYVQPKSIMAVMLHTWVTLKKLLTKKYVHNISIFVLFRVLLRSILGQSKN